MGSRFPWAYLRATVFAKVRWGEAGPCFHWLRFGFARATAELLKVDFRSRNLSTRPHFPPFNSVVRRFAVGLGPWRLFALFL